MISDILPVGAVAAVSKSYQKTQLTTDEIAKLALAGYRRRNEFTTVRWCAEQAFMIFGHSRPSLVPGKYGESTWPSGFVGSMSHCKGLSVAVLARTVDVTLIGIDAEPHNPLPQGVLELISSTEEYQHIDTLNQVASEIAWDRLLFSAKESLYKAWPAKERCPSFLDVNVTFFLDNTFVAITSVSGGPCQINGRWGITDGFIVTCAFVLPAS